MKKHTILAAFFLIITCAATAQKVITLSVNQPPELGFSILRQDTTILLGTTISLAQDIVVRGGSGNYSYSWTPSETLNDPTILNPVATPLDTTNYLLTVTDQFGCSFSLYYTVNTRGPLVGSQVAEKLGVYDAILFPNPNEGKFKVQIKGPQTERIEITVFNSSGRRLASQSIENFMGDHTEALDLNLTSGIYTLSINCGTENLSRQFIIR